MPMLSLLLGPEPHWPELNSALARVIHLDGNAPAIQIASLPHGTSGGKASVCLRLDLPMYAALAARDDSSQEERS